MTSIADGAVSIQTSAESVPATPSWFGEVTLIVGYLRKHDVLTAGCQKLELNSWSIYLT